MTNEAREKVKQALEWEGASVLQTFDFKVSAPAPASAAGLLSVRG